MVSKIGIVTPYKDQRRALRRELLHRFGREVMGGIEVSTVDGFQGQEREVIIFSCVRTGESRGIGFLNDTRRLNVALTRAQCSLFVLGKASALGRNPIWGAMIEHAKARGSFVPVRLRIRNPYDFHLLSDCGILTSTTRVCGGRRRPCADCLILSHPPRRKHPLVGGEQVPHQV